MALDLTPLDAAALVPRIMAPSSKSPGARLRALRDRSVLLMLANGLSIATVCALQREDIGDEAVRGEPLHITAGRELRIAWGTEAAICPVRACWEWLSVARVDSGPLYRKVSGGTVHATPLNPDSVRKQAMRWVESLSHTDVANKPASVVLQPDIASGYRSTRGLVSVG